MTIIPLKRLETRLFIDNIVLFTSSEGMFSKIIFCAINPQLPKQICCIPIAKNMIQRFFANAKHRYEMEIPISSLQLFKKIKYKLNLL